MTEERSRWPAIAIDFDHTLVHPQTQQPYEGARETLERWRSLGVWIIIHSCRSTLDGHYSLDERQDFLQKMVDLLDGHHIPWDQIWDKPGKPNALWYLDDRAVCVRDNWYIFGALLDDHLTHAKTLGVHAWNKALFDGAIQLPALGYAGWDHKAREELARRQVAEEQHELTRRRLVAVQGLLRRSRQLFALGTELANHLLSAHERYVFMNERAAIEREIDEALRP